MFVCKMKMINRIGPPAMVEHIGISKKRIKVMRPHFIDEALYNRRRNMAGVVFFSEVQFNCRVKFSGEYGIPGDDAEDFLKGCRYNTYIF